MLPSIIISIVLRLYLSTYHSGRHPFCYFKKNAILMVDFALDAQRNQDACILRFRPIMMPIIAVLMGALPIALDLGAGTELRQPIGISVAVGLILSQFVTLIVTPVIHLYLSKYAGNDPMDILPTVLEGV